MRTLLALTTICASSALASPALVLTQSGRILAASEAPAVGPVTMTFELHTLFAAGTGDRVVWTDTYADVPLDKSGAYALVLGQTDAVPPHAALTPELFAGDRWLAVAVNGQSLIPWLRIGMIPSSAHALDAERLAGKTLADLDARYLITPDFSALLRKDATTLPLQPAGAATSTTFLRGDGQWAAPDVSALLRKDATTLPLQPSGTATATTFLRGDGQWAAPAQIGAMNLGTTGVGIYDATSTGQLQFRPLVAGSPRISVALDAPTREVRVDVVESALSIGNLGGTLPVSKGGTGATTLASGGVLLGAGASPIQAVAPGATGNVLTSDGTTWISATPPILGGSGGGGTAATQLAIGTTAQRPTTPADGMIRVNTTTRNVETYYGGSWYSLGVVGTYTVEYLVVGGGGGGGSTVSYSSGGGGGGAGGFRTATGFVINPGTGYGVVVGAGGAGGTAANTTEGQGKNGADSTFAGIVAAGGGGGGSGTQNTPAKDSGLPGGSGGGAGNTSGNGLPGAGNTPGVSPSQGSSGGSNGGTAPNYGCGGGGGAGAVGGNGTTTAGGVGGAGVAFNGTTYAGGGGGGTYNGGTPGVGGAGGGGNGGTGTSAATAGAANRGGGGGGNGGGSGASNGGNGGSGIVIIRYPGTPRATGGTITNDGTTTTHTFTTVGTATFTG